MFFEQEQSCGHYRSCRYKYHKIPGKHKCRKHTKSKGHRGYTNCPTQIYTAHTNTSRYCFHQNYMPMQLDLIRSVGLMFLNFANRRFLPLPDIFMRLCYFLLDQISSHGLLAPRENTSATIVCALCCRVYFPFGCFTATSFNIYWIIFQVAKICLSKNVATKKDAKLSNCRQTTIYFIYQSFKTTSLSYTLPPFIFGGYLYVLYLRNN